MRLTWVVELYTSLQLVEGVFNSFVESHTEVANNTWHHDLYDKRQDNRNLNYLQ